MKKITLFILCICLLLAVFSLSCFATNEVVPEEPAVDEENVTETPEQPAANIFTRLYEFWIAHEAEIITAASSVVLIVLNVLTRKTNKTINNAQNDTIGGVNQLIEAYDAMMSNFASVKESFLNLSEYSEQVFKQLSEAMNEVVSVVSDLKTSDADLAEKLSHANEVIQDLVEKEMQQNNALMDVLSSVYTNSKLPQGIKDLVAMKRTENMRIVEAAHEITHPTNAQGGANDVK